MAKMAKLWQTIESISLWQKLGRGAVAAPKVMGLGSGSGNWAATESVKPPKRDQEGWTSIIVKARFLIVPYLSHT